jgi:hypothetical protein
MKISNAEAHLSDRNEMAQSNQLTASKVQQFAARGRKGREQSKENRPAASLARMLRESEFVAGIMRGSFRALQRVGVNVTPCHYYWPIPDVDELERRDWPERAFSIPFDLRLAEQLNFVRSAAEDFGSEWAFSETPAGPTEYHFNNGFFETYDAEVAYSFVRRYKPTRIIEIGAGFSTRILATALRANLEESLIPACVQEVNLDLFSTLDRNDILFIDSSHVVGVGSDVVREYLEILPRLRPGVIVHIHDIFLPSDYPRESVLKDLWFWSEQYLLQAFLTFNSSFQVLWASSAMQTYRRKELEMIFPRWATSYRNMPKKVKRFLPTADRERVWPSSFWMTRL